MTYEPNDRAIPVLVKLTDKIDANAPESPKYDPSKRKITKDQLADLEKERQDRVKTRWFLEAVGIGATGREKEVLEAWTKDGKNKDPKVAELVAWRMNKTIPDLPPSAEAPKKKK